MRLHPTDQNPASDRRFRKLSRALWLRRAPSPCAIVHAPSPERHAPATRHYRR